MFLATKKKGPILSYLADAWHAEKSLSYLADAWHAEKRERVKVNDTINLRKSMRIYLYYLL